MCLSKFVFFRKNGFPLPPSAAIDNGESRSSRENIYARWRTIRARIVRALLVLAQAEISSSLIKRSIAVFLSRLCTWWNVSFFEDGSPNVFEKCGGEGYMRSVNHENNDPMVIFLWFNLRDMTFISSFMMMYLLSQTWSFVCNIVTCFSLGNAHFSEYRWLDRSKWSWLRDPEFELFLDASHLVLYVHSRSSFPLASCYFTTHLRQTPSLFIDIFFRGTTSDLRFYSYIFCVVICTAYYSA